MLQEKAVLNDEHVCGNPVARATVSRETAVQHHVVILRKNQRVLIAQGRGRRPNKVKESVSTGRDVSTVLNIARRPELLCPDVVALVEECLKRLQYDLLILVGRKAVHGVLRLLVPESAAGSDPAGWRAWIAAFI